MATRRRFIKTTALSVGALSFPSILIPQDKEKLGVALVGLGYYSGDLLAPALQLTQHCELKGIVTGSDWKIPEWQEMYGIEDDCVYNYGNMAEIANNPKIDVVYIVLPNSLHARYAVVAAEAGKHVWCEKPMALNVEECQSIIDTCAKNNVRLSIGYRMQHEPNTKTIMDFARTQPFGKMKELKLEAGYSGYSRSTIHWKLVKAMGGGAMYDMGVYCVNGARYATGREPVAVTAKVSTTRPDIFKEVDETTTFNLEFPDGVIAKCITSFGANLNTLSVDCKKGWYTLRPFQSYNGIRGMTSEGEELNLYVENQQAKQMDDDALAIMNDTAVLVPGDEGLKDVQIVEAIKQSASLGGTRTVI